MLKQAHIERLRAILLIARNDMAETLRKMNRPENAGSMKLADDYWEAEEIVQGCITELEELGVTIEEDYVVMADRGAIGEWPWADR